MMDFESVSSIEAGNGVRPPHAPWLELSGDGTRGGYLSYYYSDIFSSLPVRAVTKLCDNKADPNLETMTYGLFSTCSKQMRKGVVESSFGWIFFFTNWKGKRVVSGYYRVGWYAPTNFQADDYCLAARNAHFVRNPIPLSEFPHRIQSRFRLFRKLEPGEVSVIAERLNEQENAIEDYIKEVRRLEQINMSMTKRRYVNFQRFKPFDWGAAEEIFSKSQNGLIGVTKQNKSKTGFWKCSTCSEISRSDSLLKLCPHCGAYASLVACESL